MSDLLIKSWRFQWAALGRAPRTIREYERYVDAFEAVSKPMGATC